MSRPTPQEIQDIRDQAKTEKAYNDSLTTMVPDKPEPYNAGAGRGRVNPPVPKNARYAGGGVTRADGCITKGHTKGRMV